MLSSVMDGDSLKRGLRFSGRHSKTCWGTLFKIVCSWASLEDTDKIKGITPVRKKTKKEKKNTREILPQKKERLIYKKEVQRGLLKCLEKHL